jgi:hypothetical protein
MFFNRSKIIQKWRCEVIRVDNECLTCTLHDLTDESRPDEITELYLIEFSKNHRNSLKKGSSFYWIISHETSFIGRLRTISEFTC